METTSILIADDHELVRKGLRHFLETEPQFRITEATDGSKALDLIEKQQPDIAILDIQMPGMTGLDVAMAVLQKQLPVKLILLTMFKDESAFNKALDLGVRGYVLKENTISEIRESISKVMGGSFYISPVLTEFLLHRTAAKPVAIHGQDVLSQLTATELRILKLLATMKTNQEIAEELSVSIKTIHNHRNNICNKLDLRGAHALLKFAIENAR